MSSLDLPLNLNPGTLGCFADRETAFPLERYRRGRRALKRVRKLVAEVWNVNAQNVAVPAGGATAIVSALATALYPALNRKRVRVLMSDQEHSGARLPFVRHSGFELIEAALGELLAKIEAVKPDVVLLSHLTYTGVQIPVLEIAERLAARENRPIVMVDATQSLGLLPEIPNVGQGIDMVFASAHKWLFGPDGSGLLWMTPELAAQLRPFYAHGEELDEEAPLGFLEASGGQDFERLVKLEEALARYQEVGAHKILASSRELSRYFSYRIAPLFERAQLTPKFYGNEFGMLFCEFAGEAPVYPLYDALNAEGIHTKLIKLGDRQLWRWGFPYFETEVRLDFAVEVLSRILPGALARETSIDTCVASKERPSVKSPKPVSLN